MKSIALINIAFLLALGLAAPRIAYAQLAANHDQHLTDNYPDATQRWAVDPVHSKVKFTVTHLVISEVDGTFDVYDGTIKTTQGDFADAKITFSADAASINTGNEDRDQHLKSEDFFFTEKYPQLAFESTSFKKKKDNRYELQGKLTMRGVTQPAVFDVTYGGTAQDGYGNTKAGFKAIGTLNRYDYGLQWNNLTEAGGLTVDEEVGVVLNLQFALAE